MTEKQLENESRMALEAFRKAVSKARDTNRRLGIPNAFVKDGELVYEMPDGSIQRKADMAPAGRRSAQHPAL